MAEPKILIIADENRAGTEITPILADLGYQVAGCVSPSCAALQRALDGKPDLIVLDTSIGRERNGRDIAEAIQRGHHIPIVYLTEHSGGETIAGPDTRVPHGFCIKPVTPQGLRATIVNTLRWHEAEKLAGQSEVRYRHLFEQSPISKWEEDFSDVKAYIDEVRETGIRDFRAYFREHPEALEDCAALVTVREVNEATCALFEARTIEDLIPGLIPALCAESREAFTEELAAIAEGLTHLELETPSRKSHGERIHLSMRWSVVPGYEADYSRVLVSFVDITARKASEAIARKNEEMLSLALEAAGMGAWDWDPTTGRGNWAVRTHRLLGYEPEEIEPTVGNWKRLVHPDDRPEVARRLNMHLQGNIPLFDIEHRMRNKAGEWVWLQNRGRVVEYADDGKPLRMAGIILDVSQRKQAEEALVESEERLRAIFEAIPDFVYLKDRELTYLHVNAAVEKFFGRPASELIGSTDEQLFGPQAAREIRRLDNSVMNGEVVDKEVTKSVGGEDRTLHVIKVPFLGPDGRVNGVCGVSRDITERKNFQAALERNQAMLARTERIADVGSWEWDVDADRVIWSDGLFRIFGRDPAEEPPCWAGHAELYHPADMERLRVAVEAAVNHGTSYEIELRAIRADGATRVCLARGQAQMDGGRAVRLFGSLQDITRMKEAERALQDRERRHWTVLNTMHDALFVHLLREDNTPGTFVEVNDVACRMLGYSREELLNMSPHEIDNADSQTDVPRVIAALLTGEAVKFEQIHVAKDGREIPVEIHSKAFYLDERPHVVSVGRDMTTQKEAQALALQTEKYKAVTDLSAGVAHNFNNLLQIVLGNTELALLDIRSGDFHGVENKLLEIGQASRFGAETVRRLSRFVKSVDPVARTDFEFFDLSDAVQQVVDMSRPLWEEEPERKGRPVSCVCRSSTGCTILGNKGDLCEVILNLTKNAVEALPKGKGGHIEVETFRAGDEVVLQVRDNGIGIPEHNHSRIFTPFFTTNVEAGRGLGLATCRTIVEAHGGRISVASTEGEGSTFTIRLPVAPARDEKLSGTQPPSSCAAGHQSGD